LRRAGITQAGTTGAEARSAQARAEALCERFASKTSSNRELMYSARTLQLVMPNPVD